MVLALVAFVATQGCSDPRPCPADAVFGLVVTVRSGDTSVCDASVFVQDGQYQEVLTVTSHEEDCVYRGADDRPGAYQISVSRDGFAPASTTSTVNKDASGCHVLPQYVTIDLSAISDGGPDSNGP